MVKVNYIILGTCLFVIFAIQNAEAGKDGNSRWGGVKKLLSSKKENKKDTASSNLPETKSSNNDDSNSSKPNSSMNNYSNSSPIQKASVTDNVLSDTTPSTQFQDHYSTPYSEAPAGLFHEGDAVSLFNSAYNEYISQQERDAEYERQRAQQEREARENQEHLQLMAPINVFFHAPYY